MTELKLIVLIVAQMRKVIQQAHRPPTQKYIFPQTEAQEIGWISQPLVN